MSRRKQRRAATASSADAPAPARLRGGRILAALAVLAALGAAGWLIHRRPSRTSLLLVTIDTLRADHVGSYGYAAAATPVMDDLARRGVRFESAHSAVPLTG